MNLPSNVLRIPIRKYSVFIPPGTYPIFPPIPPDNTPKIVNRNPRNLERLRIARKPEGYGYDKKIVHFWHKLVVLEAARSVQAALIHNTGATVVKASTSEWAMKKFLYSSRDKLAYITLGKVFAERCLESGITHFLSTEEPVAETNLDYFIRTLKEEGLTLNEPKEFELRNVFFKPPEKKPWTVMED